MIGEPVLRIVIGADLFGAVAGADHRFAFGGLSLFIFALLVVVDSGPQDFQGGGLVLVLRALVLALHHRAGWNVGDADGGVGGVDVLAAGSLCAVGIDTQIFVADFNVDFFDFGEYGDGGGRSVYTPLCFGLRYALDAVGSAFVLENLIDIVAFDGERDFLVAAGLGGADIHDTVFPAFNIEVAGVHAVEVAAENTGFVAAGSGPDFHNHVAAVGRIRRNERDHHFALGDGQLFFRFGKLHFGDLAEFLFGAGVGQNGLAFGFGVDQGQIVGCTLGQLFLMRVFLHTLFHFYRIGRNLGLRHTRFEFADLGVELFEIAVVNHT